jgi:hypothetical protein
MLRCDAAYVASTTNKTATTILREHKTATHMERKHGTRIASLSCHHQIAGDNHRIKNVRNLSHLPGQPNGDATDAYLKIVA